MLKIQFLNGGLANQAFQYIFARHYELSHPGQVMYMDDSYFALNTVHNGYELGKVFGIQPHMLSQAFDEDVWQYILEERQKGKSIPQIFLENGEQMRMIAEMDNSTFNPFEGESLYVIQSGYNPMIQEEEGNIYYHGYWLDYRWFMRYGNIFRREFRFPPLKDYKNEKYMDEIHNSFSVSVHVRRGDYVDLGLAMGIEVYRKCIEDCLKRSLGRCTLFVFSDDICWCRAHERELGFGKFAKTVYVEGNDKGNNYIDLQLMSNCKGMIMSNSAFCYLASILNTNLLFYMNPTDRIMMDNNNKNKKVSN
jgi:hypothetical protein